MNTETEIIPSMSYLGIDKIDARVYIELLRTGPIAVGALAKKLELDRGKVYRSISELSNWGIVSTTLSNPIKCSAVEPKKAIEKIIQRKNNEIVSMEKISAKLVQNLEMNQRPVENSEDYSFSIVQGRSNIYSAILGLLSQASNPVYLIAPIEDVVLFYHTAIPEKIKDCKKRGVNVFLLTNQSNKTTLPILKKINATEVRIFDLPSKSRIIVENEKQLIMSTSTKNSKNVTNTADAVFYTNSLEIINTMYYTCKQFWDKSVPLGKSSKFKNVNKTESDKANSSNQTNQLGVDKIIINELNKYLREQIIPEKTKKLKTTYHKINELEQEKIILKELNKLSTPKKRKK